MIAAKPVSLSVRPFQVSNLCFQVGGILLESFAELGSEVSAFDFRNMYAGFRSVARKLPTIEGPDGRVLFDSDEIDGVTKNLHVATPRARPSGRAAGLAPPFVGPGPPIIPPHGRAAPRALAALRAEPQKAALNKAITQRANAFITKYGNVARIAAFMRVVLPDNRVRIERLSQNIIDQTNQMDAAYRHDGRTGVVKATTSVFDAKVVSSTILDTSGEFASRTEHQETTNTDYGYRTPLLENQARHERFQMGLADESLSNFMQSHYLDRIEEVFKNELASIDADINQLQVAYLNTILLSPIDGIVTGVYKNPGDSVSAGEPVFRVEDNSEVLIVANVICRGPIALGSMLQVKTPLFDSPDSRVTLEAPVVSVRGQRDNDHWEVIAKRSNLDASGKIIFPLGYNFDYDATEVAIFGSGEI